MATAVKKPPPRNRVRSTAPPQWREGSSQGARQGRQKRLQRQHRRSAAAKALAPAGQGRKADKAKKPKLVRDSFTIPKTEYAVLEALEAARGQGWHSRPRRARCCAPASRRWPA